jgi:hypothetical protein
MAACESTRLLKRTSFREGMAGRIRRNLAFAVANEESGYPKGSLGTLAILIATECGSGYTREKASEPTPNSDSTARSQTLRSKESSDDHQHVFLPLVDYCTRSDR